MAAAGPGLPAGPHIASATLLVDVLQAFMFNCLKGGRRLAKARRMQDDSSDFRDWMV